jgi:hypothetical protein
MLTIFDSTYYKHYLRKHFLHFIINSPLVIVVVFFYQTFGFYGWPHLISVILLAYASIPLDEYLDSKQRFPSYIIPMFAFSGIFYPWITLSVIVGCLLINLRALLKSSSFLYERIEGIGMLPLAIFPFILPLSIHDFTAYLPPLLFVLIIDSFHKIAHKESINIEAMWISGVVLIAIVVIIYVHTFFDLFVLLLVVILPIIGLKVIADYSIKYTKTYYQIWQGIVTIVLFAKYPEFLLVNFNPILVT